MTRGPGPGWRCPSNNGNTPHSLFTLFRTADFSVCCPLSTVHCTEGTERRDVSMMLREGVEVERVEVLSDGGADGGGQR